MLKKMFEPGRIGNLELKNRIIMAPMGDFMFDYGFLTSEQQVHYFTERAKGGAGLIFQNVIYSLGEDESFNTLGAHLMSRMNRLTTCVHSYGAKMGAFLMMTKNCGCLFPNPPGTPSPKAPSKLPIFGDPSQTTAEYTTEEVYQLIENFGRMSAIVYKAGYDIISMQGYGGYLIDQFMSKQWNQRTDEFGGSLENRMRLPLELIRASRKATDPDFPIMFKMTATHLMPGWRQLPEAIEMAKMLEAAGACAIQIDTGCYEVWYEQIHAAYHQERAKQFEYAGELKKAVNIPVFTQGMAGDPAVAEAVLAEGKTDFVSLGRSFLADPEWPLKVENNKPEDIRPCILCNEGCIGYIFSDRPCSCAVNIRTGREHIVEITPAKYKKRVIVVGGGPAGCEAALVAAERGHTVELWEKGTSLGGALIPASSPVNKKQMRRLIEFYKAQVYKNPNIKLCLNTEATPENLLEENPDAVIVATGGKAIVPDLPGGGSKHVYAALDTLCDKYVLGKKVVVVGGGFVGCETAMHLDHQGKQVTLVEMQDSILSEPAPMNTHMMLSDIIKKSAIQINTRTKLVEVEDGAALVSKNGGEPEKIMCDAVVLAIGFKQNLALRDALAGKVKVLTAGDANKARKVLDAVWEGYAAAMGV